MRGPLLAQGRKAAESGMVDTCSIKRVSAEVTDPYSGETEQTVSTIYTGKCRFQQSGGGAQAQQADVGEAYLLIQRAEIQLPVAVVGLQVGDVVTCTAAGRDPDLVGRSFLVRDLPYKTDATSRRVQITEQTS